MRKSIRTLFLTGVGLFGGTWIGLLTTTAPMWIWPMATVACIFGATLTYIPEAKAWLGSTCSRKLQRAVGVAKPVHFHIGTGRAVGIGSPPSLWRRIGRFLSTMFRLIIDRISIVIVPTDYFVSPPR